ncbi:MAG: hypothetical protein HZB33_12740 [Nitrospirae bacterium]|nr:hypothetical protein [Nitrospirota bacterium]
MKRLMMSAILCLFFSCPAVADDEFYNSQLNRGITDSEIYAYSLISQSRLDSAGAGRLLDSAARYSPDLPAVYFALAKKDFSPSFRGVMKSIDYLLSGITAYSRNFWWSFTLAGALYFSLVFSFIGAYLVILAVRLFRDVPLVSHDIKESSSRVLLLAALIALSVISPLFFIAGCLVLTGLYMKKTDRPAVYLFLLFLFASPVIFSAGGVFIKALSSGRLKAVVQTNESKGNIYALTNLKNGRDFIESFSYALSLKREGRYGEAIEIYKRLLEKKSDPRVMINLGNCYVGLYNFEEDRKDDLDEAVKYYKLSLNEKPSPSAYYNLSEVSRELLEFSKGNEYFSAALNLNRAAVADFMALSSRNPNRFVVDETVPFYELWTYARTTKGGAGKAAWGHLPLWIFSVMALLMTAAFYVLPDKIKGHAYRCRKCNVVRCSRCEYEIVPGQICSQCYGSITKLAELDVKERVARILSVYDQQNRRRTVMKILSFVMPGSAYVYSGKILYGFLILWTFLFLLLLPLVSSFFMPGGGLITHGFFNWASLFAALLFYIVSNILTREGISKGWL